MGSFQLCDPLGSLGLCLPSVPQGKTQRHLFTAPRSGSKDSDLCGGSTGLFSPRSVHTTQRMQVPLGEGLGDAAGRAGHIRGAALFPAGPPSQL